MKTLLCVIDFEATCWQDHKAPGPDGNGWVEPRTEIIEIGAAMVGLPALDAKGEFDLFVRPKVHPELTSFCKRLTSIRQEDVDAASGFPEALAKFGSWLASFGVREDMLFASWGYYDKKQLASDCDLHGSPYPFDAEHFNIKQYVGSQMGGMIKGVTGSLERLGMKFEGTPHRGIDDVHNILRILRVVGLDLASPQFSRALIKP